MSQWPIVHLDGFKTTDDVVWTGHDGKPRCARHPYICLVRAKAVGIDSDGHVCARCMRESRGDASDAPT